MSDENTIGAPLGLCGTVRTFVRDLLTSQGVSGLFALVTDKELFRKPNGKVYLQWDRNLLVCQVGWDRYLHTQKEARAVLPRFVANQPVGLIAAARDH